MSRTRTPVNGCGPRLDCIGQIVSPWTRAIRAARGENFLGSPGVSQVDQLTPDPDRTSPRRGGAVQGGDNLVGPGYLVCVG